MSIGIETNLDDTPDQMPADLAEAAGLAPEQAVETEVGALLCALETFGSGDVVWHQLAGEPMPWWSLRALAATPGMRNIVLIVSPERVESAMRLCDRASLPVPVCTLVARSAPEVVLRDALDLLAPACDPVILHDAHRPLATPALFARSLMAAREYGIAVAAVPVKDTMKRVRDGVIVETIPRDELATLQTPQAFVRAALLAACSQATVGSDLAGLAFRLAGTGAHVGTFPGSHENVCVTSMDELAIAEQLLIQRTG